MRDSELVMKDKLSLMSPGEQEASGALFRPSIFDESSGRDIKETFPSYCNSGSMIAWTMPRKTPEIRATANTKFDTII